MTWKELRESWRRWRRGERKIKGATRGRIYVRKDASEDEGPGNVLPAKSEPTAVIKMKVTRVDGTVEHIEVPAKVVAEVTKK
jgi:hypothetical protein